MSKRTQAVKSRATTRKQNAGSGIFKRFGPRLPMDRLIIGGSILFSLAIVGVLAVTSSLNQIPRMDPTIPDESETVRIQSAEHVAPDAAPTPYNSNPPTSGQHYAQAANWGIYREALPDETLIHNLEHGGIWLSYRDADDENTIAQLADITRRYPSHVILTHRPVNDSPVAVSAWGRQLKLDTVDSGEIYNFITRYQFKGPENVR